MDLFRTDFSQFEKPGRREDFDYPDMAKEAGWFTMRDGMMLNARVHEMM